MSSGKFGYLLMRLLGLAFAIPLFSRLTVFVSNYAIGITYLDWRSTLIVLGTPALLAIFGILMLALASQQDRRAARVAYVAFFLSGIAYLRSIDMSWAAFNETGPIMLGWFIARMILCLSLLAIFHTAGALIFKNQESSRAFKGMTSLEGMILCGFTGATALALLSVGLGMAGLLRFWVVFAVATALVALSPSIHSKTLVPAVRKAIGALRNAPISWKCLYAASAVPLSCSISMLAYRKAFFPISDGDSWEHYVPYYREVLRSGRLGPNEIWYHFFISKGAGLFYLANALTNVLSTQIVSFALLLLTFAALFDLLRSILRAGYWGVLGVTLMCCAIHQDYWALGAFFKHHIVLMSLYAFLFWTTAKLIPLKAEARRPYITGAALAAFYLGFYQPIPSGIIAAFFGIAALGALSARNTRPLAPVFLGLLATVAAGTLTDFLVNFGFTGLVDAMPITPFWKHANRHVFDRVFGSSGALFLLQQKNDVAATSSMTEWLVLVFRSGFFRSLLPGAAPALVGTALLFLERKRKGNSGKEMAILAVLLAAFLVPSVALAYAARVDSTARFFVFTFFFSSLITVLLLGLVFENLIPMDWCRSCCAILAIGLSTCLIGREMSAPSKRDDLRKAVEFAGGGLSFEEALRSNCTYPLQTAVFNFLTEARKKVGDPEARIMMLGYLPSAAYSFPGRGIMSEPTYALGPHFIDMVFGPPETARSLLQERGIRYFVMTTRLRPFSGLAFSPLFRADQLSRYFEPVFESDGFYLITWRASDKAKPMPTELVTAWDYSLSGILPRLYGTEFASEIARQLRKDAAPGSEGAVRALRERLQGDLRAQESRTLLESILARIQEDLRRRQGPASQPQQEAEAEVSQLRDSLAHELIGSFGDYYDELASGRDKGGFRQIYESKESVLQILTP